MRLWAENSGGHDSTDVSLSEVPQIQCSDMISQRCLTTQLPVLSQEERETRMRLEGLTLPSNRPPQPTKALSSPSHRGGI